MKKLRGKVLCVTAGDNQDLSKDEQPEIEVNFEGIVGDRHAGPSRKTWAGEREPDGARVRNERQWSAISREELEYISERLDLTETLTASTLGCNLCVEGVEEFSLLPPRSRLVSSSRSTTPGPSRPGRTCSGGVIFSCGWT